MRCLLNGLTILEAPWFKDRANGAGKSRARLDQSTKMNDCPMSGLGSLRSAILEPPEYNELDLVRDLKYDPKMFFLLMLDKMPHSVRHHFEW